MARISNWPRALSDYITENERHPFIWGEHDCLLFAAGAIKAITEHDPANFWRGKYHSAFGAARVFKDWGGIEEMVATIAGAEGYEEEPVKLAQRGDLMLHHQRRWPAGGICMGVWSAFAGADQITMLKTASCARAWRVN